MSTRFMLANIQQLIYRLFLLSGLFVVVLSIIFTDFRIYFIEIFGLLLTIHGFLGILTKRLIIFTEFGDVLAKGAMAIVVGGLFIAGGLTVLYITFYL